MAAGKKISLAECILRLELEVTSLLIRSSQIELPPIQLAIS